MAKKRNRRAGKRIQRQAATFAMGASQLQRRSKQLLILAADIIAIPAALWTAVALRFGTPDHPLASQAWLYPAVLLATVPVFVHLGLYRAIIRFIGAQAIMAIFAGVTLSTALLGGLNALFFENAIPLEVLVIYFVLASLYVSATRLTARELLRLANPGAERVVIYGAGVAGAQLCTSLAASTQFRPVGIVDDNLAMHGIQVRGLKVLPASRLGELRRRHQASLVLLALPSATRRRRSDIIDSLTSQGFRVQTVPDIAEIVSGRARLEEVRDIDARDLLWRDPVPPYPALLSACISGKSILVTGAGGSIGSELCRQIMALAPRRLVLLEVSEHALYEIERELRTLNIKDGDRIEPPPITRQRRRTNAE
ncbi:MAG: hypothetical protein K0Q64_2405 [Nitrobacter vulgaris]|nr:hypothetical protein [Nitrobacter vulgaris]